MTILSFGNFYLGIDPDRAAFFDVQIHLGIIRLELSGPPPKPTRNRVQSVTEASHQCTDGEALSGIRDAAPKGS